MTPLRSFTYRVTTLVTRIPRGRVTTYGAVAAACGTPRAARQVGWILSRSVQTLPWQRVVNHEGRLSIVNPQVTAKDQARLLRKEGVEVAEHHGALYVDLSKYLWNPSARGRRA